MKGAGKRFKNRRERREVYAVRSAAKNPRLVNVLEGVVLGSTREVRPGFSHAARLEAARLVAARKAVLIPGGISAYTKAWQREERRRYEKIINRLTE